MAVPLYWISFGSKGSGSWLESASPNFHVISLKHGVTKLMTLRYPYTVMWSETVSLRTRPGLRPKKSVLVLHTVVLVLVLYIVILVLVLQVWCCIVKHDLVTLVVIIIIIIVC